MNTTYANDLSYIRYVKKVMKYGIPRPDAKEIVESAMLAGNGKEVEMYLTYAITLKYGLKLPKQKLTV